MLKNIKLHIDSDEEHQAELEKALAADLQTTFNENLRAFKSKIPSLEKYVKSAVNQNVSIICNQHGEANIVDFGLGRVFYGFHPKQKYVNKLTIISNTVQWYSWKIMTAPQPH